jgi:methionyl-tRNA formyltransferase
MQNKDIKFAFFGTPDLVIPILDELARNHLLPALIVTGPDREKGRGLTLTPPAPKVWAKERDIPVLQPEKIDASFVEEFKKHNFDLGVVVAYGKILPELLINAPKHGMINVHYSLLPKYRGATPVESAILNGDTETGVCIQKMAFALDAGDVITEEKVEIGANEKAFELRNRLNEIAKMMLPKVIQEIMDGKASYTKQDDTKATICRKIKKEDGLIDLNASGKINYLKFRAYFGWPGSYFFVERDGKQIRIKITDASFENNEFKILKVIPEGKREINYDAFQRGL